MNMFLRYRPIFLTEKEKETKRMQSRWQDRERKRKRLREKNRSGSSQSAGDDDAPAEPPVSSHLFRLKKEVEGIRPFLSIFFGGIFILLFERVSVVDVDTIVLKQKYKFQSPKCRNVDVLSTTR